MCFTAVQAATVDGTDLLLFTKKSWICFSDLPLVSGTKAIVNNKETTEKLPYIQNAPYAWSAWSRPGNVLATKNTQSQFTPTATGVTTDLTLLDSTSATIT